MLLRLAALAILLVPARAFAWGSVEHIDICHRINFPPAIAELEVEGYRPEEWCALPDFAWSVTDLVANGQCNGYRNFTGEWWDYFVEGPCLSIVAENVDHFGGYAYTKWAHYHELAKMAAAQYASSCTPGCDAAAAALEGWGLHYLGDSFAAGHAWNPLGDWESSTGVYWIIHSGADLPPDILFPPAGDINVFRLDIHNYFNDAQEMGGPVTRFAAPFDGPPVLGDAAWEEGRLSATQTAWTLARTNASVMEIYWTLAGVNGVGGCTVANVCGPDSDELYLDQGNKHECVPFVSNESWANMMVTLGANSNAYTYYGQCEEADFDPTGHFCATAVEGRGIPFWSGSKNYAHIDGAGALAALGCDTTDPAMYEGGNCAETKYAGAELRMICEDLAPGACDFHGTCDVPVPTTGGGGTADAGPGGGASDAGGGPGV